MLHRTPPRPGLAATAALALGAALALAWAGPARAQVGPEESARQIKPAEGLEATLWAAEPMVINPTNMDVDSRGRVWVTEGLNYRLTRGRNKDFAYLEQADRIKILEDTDGDGKADKVTVFADKVFPVPMGLAVEDRYGPDGTYLGCRVYVGNSPDLLVFEDTDGDDKADTRTALLTGFGGVDSDHGVHGMTLGLDGKLYFTHGDGCCSVQPDKSERVQNFNVLDRSGRRVASDQLANTLRVNRDGTQFEVLADRQRNNYETSLNAFGNIFTSDNDDDGNRGSRVIWIMDGGTYGYRTPGSPRHWGEEVPGNVPKLAGTGNGSPCGITVYEGGLLPAEYQGAVLEADAGTRQINFFPITRHGAAFRTDYKVFLSSDDPWFRPVDMTAAPDGSVLVADWYDAGVGGHAFSDQTTGRIYRVTPKGKAVEATKFDFGTVEGLIAALKSPNVAAQDAARRSLMARGKEEKVLEALTDLFQQRDEPLHRARALWVLHAVAGNPVAVSALKDDDPRIREQAVRILGRDVSREGTVEYVNPAAEKPWAAAAHLPELLPLAADPDAGVRRELILALRGLPTDQVGAALRTLAASWDGRDRWYLEALGLALEDRDSDYLAALFDGNLYGDLGLPDSGKVGNVALPPYFPADRNEAYLSTRDELPPANALSKTLGLAWRIHRAEVLPILGRTLPSLEAPELQQVVEDVLQQVKDPAGAVTVAQVALRTEDPVRRNLLLATLARKLEGPWRPARDRPSVVRAIDEAMRDPATRAQGVAMAAATGNARYAKPLMGLAVDESAADEVRVAAVEGIGRLRTEDVEDVLNRLIGNARMLGRSTPVAEAAVRVMPEVFRASNRLRGLMLDAGNPLGIRREALRTLARQPDGGLELVAMARQNRLPADLVTEATTVLNVHPDRRVRDEAAQVLPLPKTAAGRPLPPLFELVRREGVAENGRKVFHREGTNACASCHRAQGRGNWIGPDLSTIGTKYGRAELLRSILNPSAAIGYNFRTHVVALSDGRVVSGLPVEETPERLVLKTAEGQRIGVRLADVDDRQQSEVSLMPEGLAQTMTDQELVDLLAFLETLTVPVSVVGQYQAVGPLPADLPADQLDPSKPVEHAGRSTAWRRLNANAESLVDLSLLAGDANQAAFLTVPVTSAEPQKARLVIDTKADVKAWLDGRPVALAASGDDPTHAAEVELPSGTSRLLIRVPGGSAPNVVTTFVARRPVRFAAEAQAPAAAE